MNRNISLMTLLAILTVNSCKPITNQQQLLQTTHAILTGAEQTEKYLPLLKGKRIGVLSNPTSVIHQTHIVDSL